MRNKGVRIYNLLFNPADHLLMRSRLFFLFRILEKLQRPIIRSFSPI